jgi:hypothetical protein
VPPSPAPLLSAMSTTPARYYRRRRVVSQEAVTIRAPSGENAADRTPPLWPRKASSSRPEGASHTRAVWSVEPVTIRVPSGENAAERTPSSCKGTAPGSAGMSGTTQMDPGGEAGVPPRPTARRPPTAHLLDPPMPKVPIAAARSATSRAAEHSGPALFRLGGVRAAPESLRVAFPAACGVELDSRP